METHRLRVKVGPHEFEAEGSQESVTAQFEAWKELIASQGAVVVQPKPAVAVAAVGQPFVDDGDTAFLDVFSVDDRRKLVTLNVHPEGKDKDGDAGLLILYGFRRCLADDGTGIEVPVTRLKESLAVSGLRPDRIDRALAPHLRGGLILKTGRGKGGRYRLSNTGYKRADELARSLYTRMNVG